MSTIIIKIITVAYCVAGIVTFVGFFPTIKDLHHKKPSANVSSYLIWTATTSVSMLYGIFVLKDLVFNIMYALILLFFITILVMRLRLKYRDGI